ncbi:MAG: rod shape-determining protein [Clostridia bacterium]|nr:rod shape-determining protein [Clostridia bacterium]
MNLNIGIDIGAANIRMVVRERGLVLDQSSACAMKKGACIATGDEAYSLLGREYASLEVAFPMAAGVISREDALEAWLRYVIGQAASMGLARVSRVLIAKPAMMRLSQAQRMAMLVMRAGASSCAVMSCDLLAAIGSGMDIAASRASFIVDIGASHISATVAARSQIIARDYLNLGMDSANGIIRRMIRNKYSLAVGPATAETVKRSLATALEKHISIKEQVTGFDVTKGFPGIAQVDRQDIRDCVEPILGQVRELAMSVIDGCDSRIQADILEDGAYVSGGGAMLDGICEVLESATGVKFSRAENPLLSVASGLEKVISSPDTYAGLLEAQQTIFDRRSPGR